MLAYLKNIMENKILNEIIDIIRSVILVENELNSDSKIDELNLDSISFVQIIAGIECNFDVQFDIEDIKENGFVTLHDLELCVLDLLKKPIVL